MDTLRPRSDANRGTGEWLVPGPAHGSNAVRPGVKDAALPGSPRSRERCRLREWGELRPQRCAQRKVLRVTQRGLALVHPLRDAGEPSVVRGDDVALLLVSQAVGVGKRAERGTHSFQGLRGRSALCTSPAAIPAFEAASGGAALDPSTTSRNGKRLFPLGRPSGEQDSIRSVVPGQETDPRFLRRETLEKPEIENECRRTAVRMEGVSSPSGRITCCEVALMWPAGQQPTRRPL